ncbi:MAG: hypothetical protein V4534_00310 [Myxococcota bacterium]
MRYLLFFFVLSFSVFASRNPRHAATAAAVDPFDSSTFYGKKATSSFHEFAHYVWMATKTFGTYIIVTIPSKQTLVIDASIDAFLRRDPTLSTWIQELESTNPINSAIIRDVIKLGTGIAKQRLRVPFDGRRNFDISDTVSQMGKVGVKGAGFIALFGYKICDSEACIFAVNTAGDIVGQTAVEAGRIMRDRKKNAGGNDFWEVYKKHASIADATRSVAVKASISRMVGIYVIRQFEIDRTVGDLTANVIDWTMPNASKFARGFAIDFSKSVARSTIFTTSAKLATDTARQAVEYLPGGRFITPGILVYTIDSLLAETRIDSMIAENVKLFLENNEDSWKTYAEQVPLQQKLNFNATDLTYEYTPVIARVGTSTALYLVVSKTPLVAFTAPYAPAAFIMFNIDAAFEYAPFNLTEVTMNTMSDTEAYWKPAAEGFLGEEVAGYKTAETVHQLAPYATRVAASAAVYKACTPIAKWVGSSLKPLPGKSYQFAQTHRLPLMSLFIVISGFVLGVLNS